jgi:small-conductance mechanosensitive channel
MTANLLLDSLRNLWESFVARLPALVTGFLVFLLFYLLARVVRFLASRSLRKMKASEHAARLVSRLGFIAVMVVGVLVGLGVMGINAGALVASLGLVSVGIGFALKDVIENFLAGIILILQRPFVVGDVVRIGEVEGAVEDVRVRDTVIRQFDGRQVFVPNAGIFTKAVINNNRNRRRRLDFDLGVGYSEDASAAAQAVARALADVDGVLADPAPMVVVRGFEESSLRLKAYFWVDPVKVNLLEVRSQAMAAAKRGLEEGGIEIPFPVLTVRPGG